MFSFKLVHVPGRSSKTRMVVGGCNGQKKRRRKARQLRRHQWVEDIYGVWIVDHHEKGREGRIPGVQRKG
jgi:hypothetical protein